MSLTKKLYKGAGSLALGKMGGKFFAILRLVILARLLTTEDMGIITLLMMTVALLEMLSQLGADKLLIQAKDGDDPIFQGCVHVTRILRGCFNAVVLLAIAVPTARFFGAPETWFAFALLAVVPLIRGLVHTDALRAQRGMKYGPIVRVDLASSALAALSAAPLALVFGDYRAGLGCIIIKALTYTVSTHVVATRPYRYAWDRAIAGRLFRFGWPMLINSALLYAITHGDKLIIGRYYSTTELGIYGLAIGLAMTARMTVAGAMNSLFLPVLARSQDEPDRFASRVRALATMLSVIGAGIAVPMVLAGGPLMALIYGAEYAAAGAFIGWLAVMQSVRLVRTAPSIAAQARADSRMLMYANMVRISSLVPMVLAALNGAPLVVLAQWGCAGEIGAIMTMLLLHRRHYGLRLACVGMPLLTASAVATGCVMVSRPVMPVASDMISIVAACAVAAVAVGITAALVPEARTMIRTFLNDAGGAARRVRTGPDRGSVTESAS